MKNIIKLTGVYLIAGAACKAGEQLWDKVLSEKVLVVARKFKTKFQKKES